MVPANTNQDLPGLLKVDEGKKNKFLNVHVDEEKDADLFGESGAISDNLGDEKPKVNMEGSQVSNQNFDEKMIETVNSEVIESGVGKIEFSEKNPKLMMENIGEEIEENDNSNPKSKSSKKQESSKEEEVKAGESGEMENKRAKSENEEPLNEPTFLKEDKPIGGLGGFESRLKNNNTKNLQNDKRTGSKQQSKNRPASAIKKPEKQAEIVPKKKEKIPHFNLKKKVEPKNIPVADLLKRVNGQESNKEETRKVEIPRQDIKSLSPEQAQAMKESMDFAKFLKKMEKKVKEDLNEIEDKKKWKPKKHKEISSIEVQKKQAARENELITKELLNPIQMMLDEMRKKDIEEAKKKLEEFQAKNGIKYPVPKKKAKPDPPKPQAPPEPVRDPVADANAYIRSGNWKKKKKEDPNPEVSKKEGEEEEPGLFTVAENEAGDENAPMSKPTHALAGILEVRDDQDASVMEKSDHLGHDPLKNLSENLSKMENDSKPPTKAAQPSYRIKSSKKKGENVSTEKTLVYAAFKKKQEEIRKKDEAIVLDEMISAKVKNPKLVAVDRHLKKLEEDFSLKAAREEEEKKKAMDALNTKNKLYRYEGLEKGEKRKGDEKRLKEAEEKGVGGRKGFEVRVGVGVCGELERGVGEASRKDELVRAREVARARLKRKENESEGNESFKRRIREEREMLRKRVELEKEKLRLMREENYKGRGSNKKEEGEKMKESLVERIVEEDLEVEEEEIEGEAPARKKRLKMKHAMKLKGYVQTMKKINEGLSEQIRERDAAYDLLKAEFEEILRAERELEKQENREIIAGIISKVPVGRLYSLLKGDAVLLKTTSLARQMREIPELTTKEKRALRSVLCGEGETLYTLVRFETVLEMEEEGNGFGVVKTRQEIEEDEKLNDYLEDLEKMGESLDGFESEIIEREIESFEAARKVMGFKKKQRRQMMMLVEIMEVVAARAEDLEKQLSADAAGGQAEIMAEAEEADARNQAKLARAEKAYHGALLGFEETMEKDLLVRDPFSLGNAEEEEKKEIDFARAAFESAQKIHGVGFREKNSVMNFISHTGKVKKSALLVQAWYRGWKARREYGVKRAMRQRVWYLVRRYLERWKKRWAERRELEENEKSERNESGLEEEDKQEGEIEEEQEEHDKSGFQVEEVEEGDQAVGQNNVSGKAVQNQGTFDGKEIYIGVRVQRSYRRYMGKKNPEEFWVSSTKKTDKCMMCILKVIRVVQQDSLFPLLCKECFEEFNLTRKKVRNWKELVQTKKDKDLGQLDQVTILKACLEIYSKILLAKKDLLKQFQSLDPGKTGTVQVEEAEDVVSRLKMLPEPQKQLLMTFFNSQQHSGGKLDYMEVLQLLSASNN